MGSVNDQPVQPSVYYAKTVPVVKICHQMAARQGLMNPNKLKRMEFFSISDLTRSALRAGDVRGAPRTACQLFGVRDANVGASR